MTKRLRGFLALLLASATVLASCSDRADNPLPPSYPEEPTPSVSSEESSLPPVSEPDPVPEDIYASISFAGDLLIHNSVERTAKTGDGTYDFLQFLENGMEDFFQSDWNVINMENPVDVYGDNSGISTYPNFNVPREVTDLALAMGVDTAIYCNNHIYDKKYSGFLASIDHISEKLEVAGAYRSREEYETPYIRDVNGIKVGLVCYTDHVNGYSPSRLEPYSVRTFELSMDSAPAMIGDIQALKEAGAELVTVYMHWGSEYRDAPASVQEELARALCEGGADIIVGGHSHCVQPMENYTFTDENGNEKTSVIMYSLGNLFADQVGLQTMEGYGSKYAKTQHGVKVTLNIKKDGETGEVTVVGGEYVPTVLLRRRVSGNYQYLFLEAGKYAAEITRPDVFVSDAEWQKCIDAYNRVGEIMGEEVVPVKTYDSENEQQ